MRLLRTIARTAMLAGVTTFVSHHLHRLLKKRGPDAPERLRLTERHTWSESDEALDETFPASDATAKY